jgi:hypothetical protein
MHDRENTIFISLDDHWRLTIPKGKKKAGTMTFMGINKVY